MIVGQINEERPLILTQSQVPMMVLGTPRMGKSTLLGHLAEQSLENDEGVLLFDIKDGLLARDFVSRTKHPDRVVYVSPGKNEGWTLNILSHPNTEQMVDEVIDMFHRLGRASEDTTLINTALFHGLWLASTSPTATLQTLSDLLREESTRTHLLANATDLPRNVVRHWTQFKSLPATQQFGQHRSTISRLDPLLTGQPIENFVSSPHSTLDIPRWLDEGKAVILDLVTGVSDRQTLAMGNLVMASVVASAMNRQAPKRFWRIIADEFDQLAAKPFIHALDKLQSMRVLPVMACQNLSQIDEELENSLSGLPVRIYFKSTGADSDVLARRFRSTKEADIVLKQKKHQIRVHEGEPPTVEMDASDPYLVFRIVAMADATGGQSATTDDWWQDPVPGQLERVRAASLRDRVKVHEQRIEAPRPSQPRPVPRQENLPTRGHRAGSADSPSPEPLSPDDQSTGGRTAVSGMGDLRGTDTLGQDVPTQSQRVTRQTHQPRNGDKSRSDAAPPADPKQVHDPPKPADSSGRKARRRGYGSGGALGFKPQIKLPPDGTKPPRRDK